MNFLKKRTMSNLFNEEPVNIPKEDRIAVRQYKQLLSIYGKSEGHKCKQCANCELWQAGSKRVFKCKLAKNSNSQATDWNSRWDACGKFIKE
jgi:hypothetical protein